MRKWYEMEACNQGPIIGGQVYLVRNIMGYPFEAKMNEEEQKALMAAVCYAVRQSEEVLQKKFVFINFSEVRDYEQQALIGKLAIPPQMFEKGHEAGILISEDESISVLVNGKDPPLQSHIPAGCVVPLPVKVPSSCSYPEKNNQNIFHTASDALHRQ